MSETGIYIRVGKENLLLEDLDETERTIWLDELEKKGLIRTINRLCDVIEDFKINYQSSVLENQKYKEVINKAIEYIEKEQITYEHPIEPYQVVEIEDILDILKEVE